MENINIYNLQRIKKLIEARVSLGPSTSWKQRDFENLIGLIYNKTKIRLSLSTIKRIWQDNYSGRPHPSTLDALAVFAGYDNWYAFTLNQKIVTNEENPTVAENREVRGRNIYRIRAFHPVIVTLVIIFAVILYISLKPAMVSFSTDEDIFATTPAKAIFRYNHKGRLRDSLFLQPNGRPPVIIGLDPGKREIEYEYRTPGIFTAFLYKGREPVDSVPVLIKTNGWIASVYNFNRKQGSSLETYFRGNDIIGNGLLNLSAEQLKSNNIKVDGNLFTLFYYVTDPFDMDYDNFILDIRVKSDSIYNYPFPYFYLGLITKDGLQFIPFSSNGNQRENAISFSDQYMEGTTTDLSMFETDVYNWMDIRLEDSNREVSVILNNSVVYQFSYDKPLELICGFNISFLGSGSVDMIELHDINGNVIYSEDFD